MNENINLCEILKGHAGEFFYCSLFGENVIFTGIVNSNIEVMLKDKLPIELYSNGGFSSNGECMLFPSKEQRDWNKWIEEQTAEEFIKLYNMEERNISITLEKAKEWYNNGSTDLKEIALQAFTKEELEEPSFKKIKTLRDAVNALGLSWDEVINQFRNLRKISRASAYMFNINIVRKALNKGYDMKLTEGNIYYPYTPFTTSNSTYYNRELEEGEIIKVGQFKVDNEVYTLFGGYANTGGSAGLGCFYSSDGVGAARANFGFLGCASREIAEHMSKYFAKDIIDAMYSDYIDIHWVG